MKYRQFIMKRRNQDIMYLSIIHIGICFSHMTPVLYPYAASYCYNYNNDITMEDFYTIFIALALGYPLGNIISPYVINILGITDTLLLLSFCNIFYLYGFVFFVTLGK